MRPTDRLPGAKALLASLMLAASLGTGGSAAAGDATEAPLVDRSLLLRFLADQSALTLVDARSPEEFAEGHIAGAINIPFDRVDEYRQHLPAERSAPIVVYCRSGARASTLRDRLLADGYDDVRVLPRRQIFWNDDVMVFNCAVPDEKSSAAQDPLSTNRLSVSRAIPAGTVEEAPEE